MKNPVFSQAPKSCFPHTKSSFNNIACTANVVSGKTLIIIIQLGPLTPPLPAQPTVSILKIRAASEAAPTTSTSHSSAGSNFINLDDSKVMVKVVRLIRSVALLCPRHPVDVIYKQNDEEVSVHNEALDEEMDENHENYFADEEVDSDEGGGSDLSFPIRQASWFCLRNISSAKGSTAACKIKPRTVNEKLGERRKTYHSPSKYLKDLSTPAGKYKDCQCMNHDIILTKAQKYGIRGKKYD
nr:unnamed protein product [Callosobruchus analis]